VLVKARRLITSKKKFNIPQNLDGRYVTRRSQSWYTTPRSGSKKKSWMQVVWFLMTSLSGLVKDRLKESDCANGYLLTVFRVQRATSRCDEKAGVAIDYVLEIDVPDEAIVDRMSGVVCIRDRSVLITLNTIRQKWLVKMT
jgi:adenylate kinase